jgi:hypothetical protein
MRAIAIAQPTDANPSAPHCHLQSSIRRSVGSVASELLVSPSLGFKPAQFRRSKRSGSHNA